MKKESFDIDEELANFKNMSVPGNKKDEWKMGPSLAENNECFMTNHKTNLAIKSNNLSLNH